MKETTFRRTAVAILRRKDGKVLIVFNPRQNSVDINFVDKDTFKFPQGGIDEDESTESAVLREIKEELGIILSNVNIKLCLNDYVNIGDNHAL